MKEYNYDNLPKNWYYKHVGNRDANLIFNCINKLSGSHWVGSSKNYIVTGEVNEDIIYYLKGGNLADSKKSCCYEQFDPCNEVVKRYNFVELTIESFHKLVSQPKTPTYSIY